MYRLHGFCQSGNSYKVAFLLRALGQAYENVFVDFMHGMTRDAAWRAGTNEMGEAPVLEDGARRLTQTGVILTHLAKKHGAYGIANKHLAASPFIVGTAPTIADFSRCGYLFYPEEESGYEVRSRFPHIAAWLERVNKIPGWALPYDILPGERIAPKWTA